jgi:hypothetical protein
VFSHPEVIDITRLGLGDLKISDDILIVVAI